MPICIDKLAPAVCRCTLAEWLEDGPRVVKEWPALKVEITDLQPLCLTSMPAQYTWQEGDGPNALPPAVFRCLPVVKTFRTYPTVELARHAAHLAAFLWAQQEAAQ